MKKVLVAILLSLACGVAQADIVSYSNITTFTGFAFPNGGSVGGSTLMVADDVVPTAGGLLRALTWSVANFNGVPVTFGMDIGFWNDAAYDGPDTFLGGLSFGAFTLGAGSGTLLGASGLQTAGIVLPNNPFWVGISFNNLGGTTGATDAELSLIGQLLFDPPTVGSSADVFFLSTATGPNFGSSPAGSFLFFGGVPPANFGWEITVPEPTSATLIGLVGCVVFTASRRRRQ